MERAVIFSIFPEIWSGPFAFVVSIVCSKWRTSSSEHNNLSRLSGPSTLSVINCCVSESDNGNWIVLKHFEKNEHSIFALSWSPIASLWSSSVSVGIITASLFRDLIVFQNCLLHVLAQLIQLSKYFYLWNSNLRVRAVCYKRHSMLFSCHRWKLVENLLLTNQ